MSETYTPQPIDPSDFDPNAVVEGEASEVSTDVHNEQEVASRPGLKARLARKALGMSSEQERRGLNATLDRLAAPERDLDQLITDDQEILGQSIHLGREMSHGTKSVMNAMDRQLASLRQKNPGSKLRDAYLSYRRDRIALKIDRLERLVTTNPESRLNKRRKKELDMFKKRLKWREGQIENRFKKATSRTEKAATRLTGRDEKLQQQIDKYVASKVEAMRRKEERKLLKREGVSKLNPAERARFIANLSAETKKRLTREAILAVREENIRKGKLDWLYEVDTEKDRRDVGTYERTA